MPPKPPPKKPAKAKPAVAPKPPADKPGDIPGAVQEAPESNTGEAPKEGVAPIEDPGKHIGTGSRPGSATSQRSAAAPVNPLPPLSRSGSGVRGPPTLAEKPTAAAAAADSNGDGDGNDNTSKNGKDAAGDGNGGDPLSDLYAAPNPPTAAPAFLERISALRAEVKGGNLSPYLDQFDRELQESSDVLVVGSLTVDEAERQEAMIDAQRVRTEEDRLRQHKSLVEDLEMRERAARARVVGEMERRRAEHRRAEARRRDNDRMREEEARRQFKRAEEELRFKLERRKGEIMTRYGELRSSRLEYGGFKGRKWLVDWEHTPQPVKIRLDLLRGCKDKIPQGRYVMVVSLYDRLGGAELRWSQLRRQTYNGSTLPVIHEGRFSDVELRMSQNVYLVVPSRADMSPSMVFVFELFLLKGRHSATDTVVAWGAFPAFDNRLDPVAGRFVTPMLRGPLDASVGRFDTMQEVIGRDVEHWLCNAYFRVEHLSKYADNRREYEVELQLTGERLGNPDRFDESEDEMDIARERVPDELGTRKKAKRKGGKKVRAVKSERRGLLDSSSDEEAGGGGGGPARPLAARRRGPANQSDDEGGDGAFGPGTKNSELLATATERRLARTLGGALDSDSDDGGDPMRSALRGRGDGAGTGGALDHVFTGRPDPDGVYRHPQPKLIDARLLERYTSSVARNLQSTSEAWAKMQFIRRDVLNDVGLKQWRTLDFWVIVVLFLVAFWLRMYMHYFGQWVYLYIMKAPFVEFEIEWHRVRLTYQADLVPLSFEIGMVTAGIGFNFLFWLFMMLIAILSQKIIGSFPTAYSRWMMAYGFAVLCDWPLILAIDLIVQDWEGDAFKLYNRYYAAERNGVAGIFLVAFINVSFTVLTAAVFYNYMLYLHYGGRIADTYARLSAGPPGSAIDTKDKKLAGRMASTHKTELPVLPHDTELALRELRWVCAKAERFRGEHGERRKVAVTTVTLTDDEDPDFHEETVHVGVFTLVKGGLELYRHFMRLSDGALVEVFGGMAGIKNESRLWLGRFGIAEVTGTLAQFLDGRLGAPPTGLGDGGLGGLAYLQDNTEIAPLAPPPVVGAGQPQDGEERKPRRPPPLIRGGRIIR